MFLKTFNFTAKLWIWNNGVNPGSWYFLSLSKKLSQEIRDNYPFSNKGFGSVPVEALVGKQRWRTSLFYSKEELNYILPIKKEIRTKEDLKEGDSITATININF